MRDLEKFDSLFKDRGGISFSIVHEHAGEYFSSRLAFCAQIIIDLINENLALKLPFPVLHFIENPRLGAVAAVSEGQYFIGINTGTCLILESLFARMCASKHILPQFGDADNELDTIKIDDPTHFDVFVLEEQLFPGDSIPIPRTNSRKQLRDLLVTFALRQIVMHEYAHIVNGHLDFMKKNYQRPFLDESEILTQDSKQDLDPLTSQTLEYDADTFATWRGIQKLLSWVDGYDSAPEELRPFIKNKNDILYLWCFSIHGMLRLFGKIPPTIEALNRSSHPPFALRQRNNIGAILNKLHPIETTDDITDEFIDLHLAMQQSTTDLEKAFREISGSPQDAAAIKFIYENNEFKEQVSKYLRHWGVVRPLLEPFALRPLPPVAEVQDVSEIDWDEVDARYMRRRG